ncbi:hypothetical protein [Photorhabdus caribbeanensis]|nr:hypothetical protein [Photorhabdus caribbeanensis]
MADTDESIGTHNQQIKVKKIEKERFIATLSKYILSLAQNRC